MEGAKVLDELVAALRRYVVLTNLQADAVALWIVFTHVHDAFDVIPRVDRSISWMWSPGLGGPLASPPRRYCA